MKRVRDRASDEGSVKTKGHGLLGAPVVRNEEAQRADKDEDVVNELERVTLEIELEQPACLVLGALELAERLAYLIIEDFQAFAVREAFNVAK